MTAPGFSAPRSLREALEILAALSGEATVVAGGQDVVPQMNQGRLVPRHLVDISRLPELRGIAVADAGDPPGGVAPAGPPGMAAQRAEPRGGAAQAAGPYGTTIPQLTDLGARMGDHQAGAGLRATGPLGPADSADEGRPAAPDSADRTGSASAAITLGALTTYADLRGHLEIGGPLSLFGDMLRQMGGGPQIRHRGTVGGAVCAAQPAYDLPACLIALDAVFVLARRGGVRRVPASSFFLDAGRTARRPDELLTAVEIPRVPSGCTSAYAKLRFSEGGYTIAGAAAVLVRDAEGVCRDARVVLSGVLPVPQRIPVIESALVGKPLDPAALGTAAGGSPGALAALVAGAVGEPIEDVMAPAGYRRMAAGVMAYRAVAQAVAR